MQLTGKVAVVTGGGSGIGQASALLLAREGAKVAVLGRTLENVEETVTRIKLAGGEAIPAVADISNPEQLQKAFQETATTWGRIDLILANAGINGLWAPIEELSLEEWNKTLSINLTGTFLTIKYAVPYLKKQGGSIVVTASVNGTRIFSNAGATAYSCSKAGQVALVKMLAIELAQYKVRINVICPGSIKSDIDESANQVNLEKIRVPVEFPEGRIPLTGDQSGTSEQVAQLVLFLLSEASSHITGTEIWIDGGESLLQG
ncbi:SDR family NAD(P)-dependent oxidoreductase [Gloeocapsa sp. PCC 73106]|uniref:SDR family oxidoreductase n=1 Tax=Gloeocapsa sp. PCC 73106 TaxID=102232 RepID=UPI0002AC0AEF|nr:SDR family NAD(P)-dependent oxidoreductase [Gloeocapsa sp. PCC 73106]ELR98243.1 dehydrogenase of unknown specificity [Gloeocapsa sp. PCC 73106]